MKSNTERSHLLLSGSSKLTANIDGNNIKSEDNKILIDITIDSNLSFNKHINNLCKKPAQSLMLLLEYQVTWTSQNIG